MLYRSSAIAVFALPLLAAASALIPRQLLGIIPTGILPTGILTTGILPTDILPTGIIPTSIIPTDILPTNILPTGILPTNIMPTGIIPTGIIPTDILPTGILPSGIIPTGIIPTGILPTGILPTGLPSPGDCNTGTINCCNSIQSSSTNGLSVVAELLGIALQDLTALVGVTCSPVTAIGASGTSCSAQPACCTGGTFGGLITLGCTPLNL